MHSIIDVVCRKNESIWSLDFVGDKYFFYVGRPTIPLWLASNDPTNYSTADKTVSINRLELNALPTWKIVAVFDAEIDFLKAKSSNCQKYLYILCKSRKIAASPMSQTQSPFSLALLRLEVEMPHRLVEYRITGYPHSSFDLF